MALLGKTEVFSWNCEAGISQLVCDFLIILSPAIPNAKAALLIHCLSNSSRFKDIDVTWLYGPLQTDQSSKTLPTPSSTSTSTSSFLDKKPILKKRTISQSILQNSHDFPQASVEDRTNRPVITGDSSAHSLSGRRHISFNNEVAQCVAIDGEGDGHGRTPEVNRFGYYNYQDDDFSIFGDEEPSDDDMVVMKHYPFEPSLSPQTTPRSSFSSDSKTIAHLPSTTLKYRSDTPEPADGLNEEDPYQRFCSSLSRSSSMETLRPEKFSSSTRDTYGGNVEPETHDRGGLSRSTPTRTTLPVEGDWFNESGIHPTNDRTFSGVFTPFGYGERDRAESDGSGSSSDSPTTNRGMFDKLVDTANTAKDIAYVIWNVGWGE